MEILSELEKVDRQIKDINLRLQTIIMNIDIIEREMAFLHTLESNLKENLTFLRKSKIIALMEDYKKSKEDLVKTKSKIATLKNDKNMQLKAKNKTEEILNKLTATHEILFKATENNVIEVDFGSKNGQE